MANGKIRFGKQSGGQLALVFPDGVADTEVIFPESGTVASVDGAVTDNSIARYDGTTGKLQNSGVTIADNGNVGIGEVPSISPWRTLNIRGAHIRSNGSAHAQYSINSEYDGTNDIYLQSSVAGAKYEQQFHGHHIFSNAPSGIAGNPITWTERMRIGITGNVLINTPVDNGVDNLQVNGSISANSFKTTNISEMYFYVVTGSTNKIQIKLSTLPSSSQHYEFVINGYNFHSTSAKNIFLTYGFYVDGNAFTPVHSAMNDILSNGFSVVAYKSADNKPCLELTRTDGIALIARGTIKQIGNQSSVLVAQVNSTTRY